MVLLLDRPGAAEVRIQPTEPAGWCVQVFVWGVWAGMSVLALALVWRYGSFLPFVDDFAFIPFLTGEVPVTPRWLWSLLNEHRVPLPRLILLSLLRLSDGDFRVGMVLNVTVFSALAAGLIRGARQVRGAASYADAFFPILLLNPSHAPTFL